MKKIFLSLLIAYFSCYAYTQNSAGSLNPDSVIVSSQVEFFIYDGPYGDKKNIKEPAVKFIITVNNKGITPIPDLGATNRTKYVNLFINDSLSNSVFLYNGIEVTGDHLINKDDSDSYTWWVFENETNGNAFTVQWQYMGLFSKKYKVYIPDKTIIQM